MYSAVIGEELMALARALARLILARNSQSVREVEITLSMVQRFPNYFDMLLQIAQIRDFTQEVRKLATVMINNFVKDHLTEESEDLGKYSSKLVTSLKDPSIDFSLKSNIAISLANIIKKDEQKQNFHSILSTLKAHLVPSSDCLHLDLCILLGRVIIQSRVLTSVELAPLLDKFIGYTLTIKEFLRVKVETYDMPSILKLSQRTFQLANLIISFFNVSNKDELNDPQRLSLLVRIVPVSQHGRMLFTRDVNQNSKIHQSLGHLKSVGYNLLSQIIKKCSNVSLGHVGDVNRKVSSTIEEIMSGLSGMFIYESQYSSGIIIQHILQSQLNFLCQLYASPVLSQLLIDYDFTILRVISYILEYSHQEIQTFISEPVYFTNRIIEIIDAKAKETEQQECQLEESFSFKVRGAQLLVHIGLARPFLRNKILEELVVAVSKFTEEGKQCINPLLMLNILCKYANCNQIAIIGLALQNSLRNPPPNCFDYNEKSCVQYALYLVTLSTFVRQVGHHEAPILHSILILAVELISDPSYFQVYQIFACELIESLYEQSVNHPWILKEALAMLISKLLAMIITKNVTVYLLDAIFHLINHRSFTIQHFQILEDAIRTVGKCIENQISYKDYAQVIVNKCWNILRAIMEQQFPLKHLMNCIQETLTPLIDFYSQNLKGDYEEDCFLLMASIIRHKKQVSKFVLEIYRIITIVFYNQYRGQFGLSFQALHLFIFYGQTLLIERKDILQQIMKMCLYSIGLQDEDSSCEGVLLLQSLVLGVGGAIDEASYLEIMQKIDKKYSRKRTNKPLYIALAGLQGLCSAFSTSLRFSLENSAKTIQRMLDESNKSRDQYYLKVVFLSTCEMTLKFNTKQMCFYSENCINLFMISHKLLRGKRETRAQSEIKSRREDVINKATELNVRTYLLSFVERFKKVHIRLFEEVMQTTEWKWKLQEFTQENDLMLE